MFNLLQKAKADARQDKKKRIMAIEKMYNQEIKKLKEAERRLL